MSSEGSNSLWLFLSLVTKDSLAWGEKNVTLVSVPQVLPFGLCMQQSAWTTPGATEGRIPPVPGPDTRRAGPIWPFLSGPRQGTYISDWPSGHYLPRTGLLSSMDSVAVAAFLPDCLVLSTHPGLVPMCCPVGLCPHWAQPLSCLNSFQLEGVNSHCTAYLLVVASLLLLPA